jgi:hypothetical protein
VPTSPRHPAASRCTVTSGVRKTLSEASKAPHPELAAATLWIHTGCPWLRNQALESVETWNDGFGRQVTFPNAAQRSDHLSERVAHAIVR